MMENKLLGIHNGYYNIFNNFKTIVPNVNLIKNIGYYNAPQEKVLKSLEI